MRLHLLSILPALTLLCLGGPLLAAPKGDAVDYEGNLSKVPATDPAPEAVPPLKESIKGVHPRLLFTSPEIEKLKEQIASDEILKKAAEDTLVWARRFKGPQEKPGQQPDIVKNDTPALVTSNGGYPALAYAYALEPTPELREAIEKILVMMVEQPYWADSAELDANMGAACNMLMVGLLYDTIYNEMTPELRPRVEEKMLLHARRMYYLGYKQLSLMPIKYWQQDPQPNHRWYRARGMAACLLPLADKPGREVGFLLQELKKEMDFLIKWYPGDCHEGPGYQRFGFRSLLDTALMMDRVLGTKYLEAPGFSHAWEMQLYYWVPARGSNIGFGDDMNSSGPYMYDDAAFLGSVSLSRNKDAQAAMVRLFKMRAFRKDGRPYTYPWSLLAYYDPTLTGGDHNAVPTYKLFPDLGAATLRDTWEEDSVIFTFKCGPYGGYLLNEYRHTHLRDGKPHYVNLAHDDPDANSIALAIGKDFIFHPGLYAQKKRTEIQNTFTVDDKGQLQEGQAYTQPTAERDMRELSYLTGWKVGQSGRIIIEGEAGESYRDDMLQGFRRTAIWMPGEYMLLLDDLKGNGPHKMTWRATVEKGMFENAKEGRCYVETKDGARMDFQILADREFEGAIDHAFMDGRFGGVLMQQFQFSAEGEAVKFATLMDPWKKKPAMTLKDEGGVVTLTVKSAEFEDTWTWSSAPDAHTPTALKGTRAGSELIALTPADKAPIPGK